MCNSTYLRIQTSAHKFFISWSCDETQKHSWCMFGTKGKKKKEGKTLIREQSTQRTAMETRKNVYAPSAERKQFSKAWQNLLLHPTCSVQRAAMGQEGRKQGEERLSPASQHTDVIVLAVMQFPVEAALITKDAIEFPLMFSSQPNALNFI